MEEHQPGLTLFERAWAWFELHRRQVALGAGVLLLAGLVISYYFWADSQREIKAGSALSDAMIAGLSGGPGSEQAATYRQVARAHPRTGAAARALLLAAGRLFEEGKFAEAQAEFERCLREYPDQPFRGQAMLGVAASLEAQGQTDAAIQAYQDLIRRLPQDVATPQAQFALARLYEARGRIEEARELYETLARSQGHNSLGNEALFRLQELPARPATAGSASPASASLLSLPPASNAPAPQP